MKTTSFVLGPYFEEFIQKQITSGRYGNASEVIRAGLRLLDESEDKLTALRSSIKQGDESNTVEDFNPEAHLNIPKAKLADILNPVVGARRP